MNWVTLSIISGLCAALNGLFAKLVTNGLTTGVAGRVAGWFGVGEGSWVVEGGVRGVGFPFFFGFGGRGREVEEGLKGGRGWLDVWMKG